MPHPEFQQLFDLARPLPPRREPGTNLLVRSVLRRGTGSGKGTAGLSVRYVHTGVERYSFERRGFAVKAGQMLVSSSAFAHEVRVDEAEDRTTIGLCLHANASAFAGGTSAGSLEDHEVPLLLPAEAFPLGRRLAAISEMLKTHWAEPYVSPSCLIGQLLSDLNGCAAQIGQAMEELGAVRPSTRRDQYRRLERARTYLHDVAERAVELDELARIAAISRFQLARHFQRVFGQPPAAYHRRVRLEKARDHLRREGGLFLNAAHRFGFADSSSFSRAYRRQFGRSPRRDLLPAD